MIFERASTSGDVINPSLLITWVAYRERVGRAVRLVNHVAAQRVGGTQTLTLETSLFTYSGTVDLTTRKAFFSDETRALGDEKWFWDGQPVTEQGLTVQGGNVIPDTQNRRLIVELDQVSLLNGPNAPAFFHWRVSGLDVFGHALSHKILVQTPAQVLTPRPISFVPPLRIDPLGDPIRERPLETWAFGDVAALLSSRLDGATATVVVRALNEAITGGAAVLDSTAAMGILSVLSQPGVAQRSVLPR